VSPGPKARRYVPERGEAVWLTFDPRAGHEQAGRRPAVVLSPRAYNTRTGLAIFCPVTTQIEGYPFEVVLPGGLPIDGVVLADQVRSLDWHARHASRICDLPAEITDEILGKLEPLLQRI
jgi:mRNA interferase MazF